MKAYRNAATVLPQALLDAIQSHVDGVFLYIPRLQENRRQWGELSRSKAAFEERNKAIFGQYVAGSRVKALAEEYHLSEKAIYRVLAAMKTQ